MSNIKHLNLETLAEYHKNLCKNPELREMFFELTLKCNENCFHCGSSCGADRPGGLPVEEYKKVLDEIKSKYCRGGSYHSWDFENDKPLVCMKEVLF